MPNYDYINPGSAAVDSLTRYMTQREMAKARAAQTQHQLQMDKIAIERETRMENDAKEDREFKKSQQEETKKDKGYQRTEKRINDMVPGDVPDPELISDAQKFGLGFRLSTKPAGPESLPGVAAVPMGQEQTGVQPVEMSTTNIGTPAQRIIKRREDYMSTLMNDPELDPMAKKALEYQQATGQTPPAGIFKLGKEVSDTQPLLRIDARGDRVEQFDNGAWKPLEGPPPKGAHWVQVQHPPQSSQNQGDDAVVYSDKAVDMFARMIGKGAPWPPMGNGNKAAANRTRIGNRLADYDKETDTFGGASSPDLATSGADYKANKDAIVKLQGIQAGVDAFAGAANLNAKNMKAVLDKVPDTGNEWLNRPYRALLGSFDNPALKEFQVYRESINNEYNRLLNTVGMTGGVTNAMKDDMKTIMSNSSTIPNILAAMEALQNEAKNRHDSYAQEIDGLRGKISSPKPATTTTPAAPASVLPPGVTVRKKS